MHKHSTTRAKLCGFCTLLLLLVSLRPLFFAPNKKGCFPPFPFNTDCPLLHISFFPSCLSSHSKTENKCPQRMLIDFVCGGTPPPQQVNITTHQLQQNKKEHIGFVSPITLSCFVVVDMALWLLSAVVEGLCKRYCIVFYG
eukprot:TRINITY_DN68073_c4_g1_i1.p1 TRINITY_DN68073_c4_g1~~TRINITY_DN68073_c4_g1_i1.p1  ORF type:complete len:141 (+),score=9.44 TRINITY_DN68073_c4_g1_i1:86-508(+)